GDIFSLGVVLFEMLTGRLPWAADSAAALATAPLTMPPTPPSTLVEGLPEDLDRVVSRALEADPAKRYPSARAFAEALETWLRRWFGGRACGAVGRRRVGSLSHAGDASRHPGRATAAVADGAAVRGAGGPGGRAGRRTQPAGPHRGDRARRHRADRAAADPRP